MSWGLLNGIIPSQYKYRVYKRQHVKTWIDIHASTRVRNRDGSNWRRWGRLLFYRLVVETVGRSESPGILYLLFWYLVRFQGCSGNQLFKQEVSYHATWQQCHQPDGLLMDAKNTKYKRVSNPHPASHLLYFCRMWASSSSRLSMWHLSLIQEPPRYFSYLRSTEQLHTWEELMLT